MTRSQECFAYLSRGKSVPLNESSRSTQPLAAPIFSSSFNSTATLPSSKSKTAEQAMTSPEVRVSVPETATNTAAGRNEPIDIPSSAKAITFLDPTQGEIKVFLRETGKQRMAQGVQTVFEEEARETMGLSIEGLREEEDAIVETKRRPSIELEHDVASSNEEDSDAEELIFDFEDSSDTEASIQHGQTRDIGHVGQVPKTWPSGDTFPRQPWGASPPTDAQAQSRPGPFSANFPHTQSGDEYPYCKHP